MRGMRLLYWGMRLHVGERHDTPLLGSDCIWGKRCETFLLGYEAAYG